jgi:phospholipid-binding lipoprotein MlaA
MAIAWLLSESVTPVLAATLSSAPTGPAYRLVQKEDADSDEFELEDVFADEEEAEIIVSDPLQPINRAVFWFNDKVYFYFFKPLARGYRLVPETARVGVQNFFSNLATPIRLVNNALQLKLRAAGTELGRFLINTTLGVGGLGDAAKRHFDLPIHDEDFGQTFAHYGVGMGPYLVLPFLGPSNVRDTIGDFADTFVDPIYWITDRDLVQVALIKGFEIVNDLSLDKDTYEAIKEEQVDPYLFVRDAFSQRRQARVRQ